MTETIPSPEINSAPVEAERKLGAVLSSMADAVGALLSTSSVDRFGRAARLCVMGQKISADLVKTIAEAKMVRALDHQRAALNGMGGAEGQYIAQGGGDINGYLEEQEDHNILAGNRNAIGQYAAMPMYMGAGVGGVPDQTQMTRDLMMMLQSFFNDQKKSRETKAALPPSRTELYDELNQAFHAASALKELSPGSPHLAVLQKQIDSLVAKIAKGSPDDSPQDAEPATTVDLVPPEFLRGHPPGAGEQWGDAAHPRRPVLHREGGGPIADGGGEAHRDHEAAVG